MESLSRKGKMRSVKILMVCLCGLFLTACASTPKITPTYSHMYDNTYTILFHTKTKKIIPTNTIFQALLKKSAEVTLKNRYSYFIVEEYDTPEELYKFLGKEQNRIRKLMRDYYRAASLYSLSSSPSYSPSPNINITINNPPPYPYSTSRSYSVYNKYGFEVGTIESQNSMTYIPYEYAHPRQAEIQRGLSSAIDSISRGLAQRQAMTPRIPGIEIPYCLDITIKCFKEKPTNVKAYVYDAKKVLKITK